MPYQLVHHKNGSTSVACTDNGEIMHPTVGPEIEAQTLYIDGLRLADRLVGGRELVIWDIGMGAASNALAVLDRFHDASGPIRLLSFDHTDQALRFASQQAAHFPSLERHSTAVHELLDTGRTQVGAVEWTFIEADFPTWLAEESSAPAPHAVFHDAWSPKSNPAMWTLSLFQQLRERVAADAALATYSRATCIRSALLLAGFHVGRGPAIGVKEETTLAATSPDWLKDPLPPAWLNKAERSHSGRPFLRNEFEQAPLSRNQMQQLRAHPQFRSPDGSEQKLTE